MLLIGIVILIYFGITSLIGHGIPCIFRLIIGFKCPGCGITTAAWAVLHGDFKAALDANFFVVVTSPLILTEVIIYLCHKEMSTLNEILLGIYAVALILWGIVRNIMMM